MDELFVGHKPCKIDAKGRISIPSSMRAPLGQSFIASRGFGNCLALYPMEEWNKFMNKIHETVSQKDRKRLEFYFSANAEKMSLDGQGRLLLNENLRSKVNLLGESEAQVFGNNTRIEIWNAQLFEANQSERKTDMKPFEEQLNAVSAEEVENILDEYGI